MDHSVSTPKPTSNASLCVNEPPKVTDILRQADTPCPSCKCLTMCVVEIKFTKEEKNYVGKFVGCPACGWKSDTVAKLDSNIILPT